ncbi:MAG: AraC family transcriptional regulator [Clostridia bacterium]|nr:AraC family transcriptional regulator [Clostridia bacterium]
MPIAFSDGNGRAFMGHEQCPGGHRFGPAIRDCFLLHFVIRGKGRLQTEDGEFLLEQGEGFFIIPGEVTTYTADPDDPWEYLWVGVGAAKENEAVLRRHGLEAGVHCFVYRDKDEVIPYLKRLTTETTLYNYEQAQGAFYMLMSTVAVDERELAAKGDRYLQMSYDYMENAYSDSLTVESLAEHLNVSRSYLYRIFKSGLGISPQRAILNFRLEKASLLVEKGGISLTEIALSCGFCDLSHFSKAYKERYRCRPKAEQGKSRE